jgi:hypothetical protein
MWTKVAKGCGKAELLQGGATRPRVDRNLHFLKSDTKARPVVGWPVISHMLAVPYGVVRATLERNFKEWILQILG